MFERYALPSRRAVFESYREARNRGASEIDAEHLLLGVMTVDGRLLDALVGGRPSSTALRAAVEDLTPKFEPPSEGSVDLPLSSVAKQVFEITEQERVSTGLSEVWPGHLLAAILQVEGPSASVLGEHGVTLAAVRSAVRPNA